MAEPGHWTEEHRGAAEVDGERARAGIDGCVKRRQRVAGHGGAIRVAQRRQEIIGPAAEDDCPAVADGPAGDAAAAGDCADIVQAGRAVGAIGRSVRASR